MAPTKASQNRGHGRPKKSQNSDKNSSACSQIDQMDLTTDVPTTSQATIVKQHFRTRKLVQKVNDDKGDIPKTISQNDLRQSWSLEEIKVVYEAMKLTGGIEDFSQLAELLPNKTVDEIETYVKFCRRAHVNQWSKVKSMFDCDKPTTSIEFWLSTMDDLVGEDGRWLRRAFSLALGILGRYEEPSFPQYDDNGEMPVDVPNYGAIYNWLSTCMLGYPEQPKQLRPIDALIVLDLLEQIQLSANIRVNTNVPPLELLQRKHKLLKAPLPKAGDSNYSVKRQIADRRVGLALAREDQCDLMQFSERQIEALLRNPPLEFDEGAGPDLPPARKDEETILSRSVHPGDDVEDNSSNDVAECVQANEGESPSATSKKIRKPYAQRLQSLNPFRLSKKYSRLELWSLPDQGDNELL